MTPPDAPQTPPEQRAFPTPIQILAVDPAASTARAIVIGWNIKTPVVLSLAMLVEATGLTAAQLPGRWLEATVNCYVLAAGDLVLRDITLAPDLPAEEPQHAPTPDTGFQGAELARAQDGSYAWRCNGGQGCDGWVGLGHPTEAAAWQEFSRHVEREHHPAAPVETQPGGTDGHEACRTVQVDGQPVHLAGGSGELTEKDRWALGEVIAAVKRKYAAEHTDGGETEQRPFATDAELKVRQRYAWRAAGCCTRCGSSGTGGWLCASCGAEARTMRAGERRIWRRWERPFRGAPIQGSGYSPAQLIGGLAPEAAPAEEPQDDRPHPDR